MAIISGTDRIFKERGAIRTLEALFSQFGERTRKGKMRKAAYAFLEEAKKVAADMEVTQAEFEGVIDLLDSPKSDLVSALYGTLGYQFSKNRKGGRNIFDVGDIPEESLALIGSNLMRYFFTRMAELAEEVGVLEGKTIYGVWRMGRGMERMFTKKLDETFGKIDKIKYGEAGQHSEAKTIKFFMSQTNRGIFLGGLKTDDARKYIYHLCGSLKDKSAKDMFDLVEQLGKKRFSIIAKDEAGVNKKSTYTFDFVRFLVGLNEFSDHPKQLEKIKRPLQVMIAQITYWFLVRMSFHFHISELSENSPNCLNIRNIRKALEYMYNVSEKQLEGKDVPIEEKSVTKTKGKAKGRDINVGADIRKAERGRPGAA